MSIEPTPPDSRNVLPFDVAKMLEVAAKEQGITSGLADVLRNYRGANVEEAAQAALRRNAMEAEAKKKPLMVLDPTCPKLRSVPFIDGLNAEQRVRDLVSAAREMQQEGVDEMLTEHAKAATKEIADIWPTIEWQGLHFLQRIEDASSGRRRFVMHPDTWKAGTDEERERFEPIHAMQLEGVSVAKALEANG